MLSLDGRRRIWSCTIPTDMRRSFDGLSALVRNELGTDPTSGNWFAFVNRRRTMMKVLAFDGDGYWIWSKRLEVGRFAPRRAACPLSRAVDSFDREIQKLGQQGRQLAAQMQPNC